MLKNAFILKIFRIDINGPFSTRHRYENIQRNCESNKTKKRKKHFSSKHYPNLISSPFHKKSYV